MAGIDYIKARLTLEEGEMIEVNELLDWKAVYDPNRGILLTGYEHAEYRGITFSKFHHPKKEDVIFYHIKGSLHKYFNEGAHNHNRFTFQDLQWVLSDLQSKFGITLSLCTLESLEVGVNLKNIDQEAAKVLKNIKALDSKRGDLAPKLFDITTINKADKIEKQGDYAEAYRTQYKAKVYDKGKQSKTGENNLRVEFATIRMNAIKRTGKAARYNIKTLADLRDAEKVFNLLHFVLKIWDEVIYVPHRSQWRTQAMYNDEYVEMELYQNRQNWAELTKEKKLESKQRLAVLMQTYCIASNEKTEIRTAIIDEWCCLYETEVNELKTLQNLVQELFNKPSATVNNEVLQYKCNVTLPHASKYTNKRTCKHCGKELITPNPKAKFCCDSCRNKHFRASKKQQKKTEKLSELLKITSLKSLFFTIQLYIQVTKSDRKPWKRPLPKQMIRGGQKWRESVREIIVRAGKTGEHVKLTGVQARRFIKFVQHQDSS